MIIRKYTSSFHDSWNSFVNNGKNKTFFFYREFMEYHKDRFNDHSLMIYNDNNKLLALFPANITQNNEVISHQGLTFGGLIISKNEKLLNVLKCFYEVLAYFKSNNIKFLIYKEIPSFYNYLPSDEIQYALFLADAELIRRDTTLTVKNNANVPLQTRRKRSIKKGIKNNVVIEETNTFDDFWNIILIPNLKERFGVTPVHTLEEIKYLHSQFPDNIRQFNAYKDNRIMAGTTIFENGKIAHAQYISGSSEGRSDGSLDLLFQKVVFEEYKNNYYFDFGICNENQGLEINFGLLDWKEGFGGRTFSHNFYKVNTNRLSKLQKVIKSKY